MFCGPHRLRVCTQGRKRSIDCLWPRTTWSFCTLDRRNTIICFRPRESPRQFPGKPWKCSFAKWFQLELAPSTAGQKRVPWITLCGSLHSGSTNSGSPHTARSPESYMNFVEPKTRIYHWRVGTRGARRDGGAGRGRAGRDADGSVRPGNSRPSCLPSHPGHRKQFVTRLDDPPEARTNKFLFKPMGEQSVRLTSGLRPVYPRDDGSLFVPGC